MLLQDGRGWAFQFVLSGWDDDAAGNLAALSSNFSVLSGDVTDFVVTATPPPHPGDRQPSPCACNVEALWVPSYSLGGVTVGVVVEDVEAIAGFANIPSMPQPGEPRVRAVRRFARDDATGVLFCLCWTSRSVKGNDWKPMATLSHLRSVTSCESLAIFLH
jgi:hypothetical protein